MTLAVPWYSKSKLGPTIIWILLALQVYGSCECCSPWESRSGSSWATERTCPQKPEASRLCIHIIAVLNSAWEQIPGTLHGIDMLEIDLDNETRVYLEVLSTLGGHRITRCICFVGTRSWTNCRQCMRVAMSFLFLFWRPQMSSLPHC